MTTPVTSSTGVTIPRSTSIADGGDNTTLSSDAFLKLLVAQLQYQDPSKPADMSAFMSETATLTQVQTMQATAQSTTDLLNAQKSQTASSLVGKTVSYVNGTGKTAEGIVSAATISVIPPTLTIDGATVDLTQIQQVLAAASS
ncbi:MAG: flgD [Frankiales bacterium]|nr:flgD [Frankiales bacterium]